MMSNADKQPGANKKYHDGFSDDDDNDFDLKKMKDDRNKFKSKRSVVVEARSKTKDDNMRNFFVNMPSYQEYLSVSNRSGG